MWPNIQTIRPILPIHSPQNMAPSYSDQVHDDKFGYWHNLYDNVSRDSERRHRN